MCAHPTQFDRYKCQFHCQMIRDGDWVDNPWHTIVCSDNYALVGVVDVLGMDWLKITPLKHRFVMFYAEYMVLNYNMFGWVYAS